MIAVQVLPFYLFADIFIRIIWPMFGSFKSGIRFPFTEVLKYVGGVR